MKQIITTSLVLLLLCAYSLLTGCQHGDNAPRDTQAPGYVYLNDGQFCLNSKTWFPLMLNYKTDVKGNVVMPISYYGDGTFDSHFHQIANWGFNSLRICMDQSNADVDTTLFFPSVAKMLDAARKNNLRVMLLIKPPFNDAERAYTQALLCRFAQDTILWAYDFMNEPLYFDPAEQRDKRDATNIVAGWRKMMCHYAPHQLFTIGQAEPIEAFEWDPALLPVDFVEMHTYHPLRVASEMYWYGHYAGKPWMVGETGLPTDNDSIPYTWQGIFMEETYRCALANGAIGYGWWEFQDCPMGNFEALYTGLRDANGVEKPAVATISRLLSMPAPSPAVRPINYYNMLGYTNLMITGTITDNHDQPIPGAVIRGWNEDWSVGMNTYSDDHGHFTLVSNDSCTHFEISAPGYSKVKFDHHLTYQPKPDTLPNRSLEYQQIDYRPFLHNDTSMLTFKEERFTLPHATADLGRITLNHTKP